jgi:hypothetical protein
MTVLSLEVVVVEVDPVEVVEVLMAVTKEVMVAAVDIEVEVEVEVVISLEPI